MARSLWKGPFVQSSLLSKVQKLIDSNSKEVIKTWSRSSTILPMFVGYTFAVHNGHKFIPVTIVEDMVGKKLGAFAPTRTYHGHDNQKVKRK